MRPHPGRSTPRYRSTTMISQSRRVTGRPLPASPAAPRAADYALYARLCLSRTKKMRILCVGKLWPSSVCERWSFFMQRDVVPCRGCVRLRRRGGLAVGGAQPRKTASRASTLALRFAPPGQWQCAKWRNRMPMAKRPTEHRPRLAKTVRKKLQSAIALSRALSPFFSPISGAPSELHWSEGYAWLHPCRLVGARVCVSVCGRAKK